MQYSRVQYSAVLYLKVCSMRRQRRLCTLTGECRAECLPECQCRWSPSSCAGSLPPDVSIRVLILIARSDRPWLPFSLVQVPFRLTRDLVDGMGVCGVGGVFTRSCEAALAVMRANKEALLTIIEVFIYDPLYKWALSPLKALQRQGQVSVSFGPSGTVLCCM